MMFMDWRWAAAVVALVTMYLCPDWLPGFPSSDYVMKCDIRDSWSRIIVVPSEADMFARISIGFNTNIDLIVRGPQLLSHMNVNPRQKVNHLKINSIDQLQETWSFFFSKGAGVERNFANADEYRKVVDAAEGLSQKEITIGGNAALMAQKMLNIFPDVKVQLVGPVGPKLKSLLNPAIRIPEASLVERDEVHLILEYDKDEMWGEYTAPVATRFITSYDQANGRLDSLETFFASLLDFRPNLLVIGGIHLLESQPEEVWSGRIVQLASYLKVLPSKVPVHLELASMSNANLLKNIIKHILPLVMSVGLNEQELAFVSFVGNGPNSQMLEGGQPFPHQVTSVMKWLLTEHGRNGKNVHSRFTRLHFHCLHFHVVAGSNGVWSNIKSSVAAGSRLAGTQACENPELDVDKFELRLPLNFRLQEGEPMVTLDGTAPVHSWSHENWNFAFSPVLVCKQPTKTVGLGDAISAIGLLHSSYTDSPPTRTTR